MNLLTYRIHLYLITLVSMFALISQSLKVIIYVPMYVGNVFLNMLSNDILSVEYLLFHLELHVDVELFRHHAIIHPSIDLFRSEI